MQTEFNEIASIEAFLDGTLVDGAKDAFEVWRNQDPDSETKIEAQQMLRDGMYVLAVESYKETLREWNAVDKQSQTQLAERGSRGIVFDREMPTWLPAVAAATCLCFLIWIGIWYADAHYSDEILAQSNYMQPEYPSDFAIGEINLRDCPTVIRSEIRGVRPNQSSDPAGNLSLLFFKGHCLFAAGDYLEAATAFRLVLEQESIPFAQSPNAYWHFILALIASDQVSDEQAIELLKQLPAESTSELLEKANVLRQDLESTWRSIVS